MAMLSALIGGIGLFLLGMILLTEGLKAAAGNALRGALERLTGGPVKAFFSGAAVTALVQSSSATTLSTIGFVSAGLLTFPQAIGVIFGANVGTTSTGWLVSLVGLRLSIGVIALPLVGIGALMRLLSSGRRASIGLALAGFGLIFVGVDTLQGGMAILAERVDPASFRADDIAGRLLLVLVGIVMTVIMQSSSAAVAATLTALHAGALRLEDAAVLVIGQSVGTTVTAGLAAIGASVPAKRTALAHVLFNLFTGAVALALLPFLLELARVVAAVVPGPAESVGIAAFHTTFKVLGVVLLLPFVAGFAALVTRLVPARGPELTRHLDPTVASIAPVAVEAARQTALAVAGLLVRAMTTLLERGRRSPNAAPEAAQALDALALTRQFLATVRSADDVKSDRERHLSVLHAIDHLESLADSIRDDDPGFGPIVWSELGELTAELLGIFGAVVDWAEHRREEAPVEQVAELSARLAELRRAQRPQVMERTAGGMLSPDEGLAHLDSMRRVDRMTYHVWRVAHHLSLSARRTAPPSSEESVQQTESWPDITSLSSG